jgi:type II secretory pathway component PulF
MPSFTFVARTQAGQARQGTEEAASATALANTLRDRGWLVLEVRPVADGPAEGWPALLNPLAWLPVRSIHIEVSLQQIAIMLRSGLTLLSTLKTVATYARRRSMREVWQEVARTIQEGSSLGEAMAKHSCFSHLVIQLVRVGEQTGTLERVLAQAAEALERRRLLKTSFFSALAYPAVVFVAAIGVAAFMIVYLIPKLQIFLTAIGRKLPPMTQLLLDISDWIQEYMVAVSAGLLILTAVAIAIYLWPPGRLVIDRLLLRVPIIGYLMRLGVTAQFAHGLAVLLSSGITLVEGLRTLAEMLRNRHAAARVVEARENVLRGGSLAEPLAAAGVFMPMLSPMVAVGEQAGTLDEVLLEVARFHEHQLQIAIRRLSVIAEPAIVVVVGGIVGFVYISFFLALFAAAGGGGGPR